MWKKHVSLERLTYIDVAMAGIPENGLTPIEVGNTLREGRKRFRNIEKMGCV